MMIEYKTPHSVMAEIKMVRTTFKGTIIVIEGASDYKFLKPFVSAENCHLMPAHGKENAIGCIPLVREDDIKGVLSFVDSDHDRILELLPEDENIVVTDYYDCEMLMIMTEALDSVISEYASETKLNKFLEKKAQNDIRSAIFKVCIPIGMFRLISRKMGFNLCFNNINFKKFINTAKMQLNIESFVKYVLANSKEHSLNADETVRLLEKEVRKNPYENEHLCNGHDYSELISMSLRAAVGNNDHRIGNRENIEKLLRLAYHFELFRQTACFCEMSTWVSRNPGFEIFPKEPS